MSTRRTILSASFLGLALLLASSVSTPAAAFDLDAPGGIIRDADGSLKARGTSGKPLVALIGDYQLIAGALYYDPRTQTGLATGDVIWRDRRAQETTEIKTDRLRFAMAAKKLTAEGRVVLTDRGLTLNANILQGDLAKEVYEADGSPARIAMTDHQIRAERLVYERTASRLVAQGGVVLVDRDLTLTADSVQGDLAKEIYQAAGSPAQAAMAGHLFKAGRLLYKRTMALIEAEDGITWADQTRSEPRLLTAVRLSYNLTEETAAAEGGVTLTAGDYRALGETLLYNGRAGTYVLAGSAAITCGAGDFSAQRLIWHPAGGWIEAFGEARFHDDVFTGQCDELRYAAGEDRVYLKGSVRLIRGEDSLTGQEIVCDLASRQVRVTGGAKATIAGT